MPTLFIRHPVRDYVVWRAAFDAHATARAQATLRNTRVYRGADAPNDILVVLDADSLDAARAFGALPEVRAAMEAAGVIGAPVVDVVP